MLRVYFGLRGFYAVPGTEFRLVACKVSALPAVPPLQGPGPYLHIDSQQAKTKKNKDWWWPQNE